MMLGVGGLIWISVKPLVKLVIPTLAGFALARAGQFSESSVKSVAFLCVNVTLPALLSSKIAVSINSQNAGAIGIIVLVALIYMITGAILGGLVLRFTRTPAEFRSGLVSCMAWSNWGDLPFAILSSLTLGPPFAGQRDADLAISFNAIFMVIWFITLFPLGGTYFIKHDYDDTRRGVNPVALSDRLKSIRSDGMRRRLPFGARRPKLVVDPSSDTPMPILTSRSGIQTPDLDVSLATMPQELKQAHSPIQSRYPPLPEIEALSEPAAEERVIREHLPDPVTADKRAKPWRRVLAIFKSFYSPAAIATLVGLLIGLVPKLHGLFITTPGSGIPNAPDGQAPLAILTETAAFLGGANVPLGLIILGSSIARMVIPRPFSSLPLMSIGAVAVSKLCIMPIIGVALMIGLVKGGLVAEDAHVLRFCICFFSAVPSATFQVALTQVYAPEGKQSNASVLCAYLLAQYFLLPVTLTVVSAVSLSLIFA